MTGRQTLPLFMPENDIKTFFKFHPIEKQRYSFVLDNKLHMIDSDFMIDVILASSEQEQEEVMSMLQHIGNDQQTIHDMLKHFAVVYVKYQ
ncbi:hypothetical protein [Sinobaca qinghaiensis]|nr:hypothetical protein [Sinobaca qinghaiensis]